jgi:hypothetical protein
MTENSAISAFGLTLVRPDTLRKIVGGGPGLRRTPKRRRLGLNRRLSGECRLTRLALGLQSLYDRATASLQGPKRPGDATRLAKPMVDCHG